MFTTVHRICNVSLSVCALIVLCALPLVVRSDVEPATATTSAENPATEVPPQTPSAPPPSPYPTEGVPGGDFVVGDFVVGPGKVDLTIRPGESRTVQMTVTNRTGERRIFNLKTEDARGSNDVETSIVLLGDDRGPYSLKDYISYPAKSFELDHNQRARIPVTITIPRDAEPGGLYGSVLVDTLALRAEAGDLEVGTTPQSAIIARIGTLFFITIPGATEHAGGLKDFSTVPEQTFYQEGPINFGILVENTGSIHLAPYGEIRITNMLGDEVGEVQLEPWFVLPQSLRLREVTWNREFLFGKYTAKAQINRSYDNVVDSAEYSFWVLPWKILLAGFLAVFFVLFIIRAFFKNFEFKRKQ